ncbi:MAG: TIGR00153 family protein [Desulfobulbaceae bacterium]|nr:TIGR00153 family protein [Desulfobulbaceae bacterium]
MVMKTTNPLAKLVRKSPFKPLQEHMRAVFSCVCMLPPLLNALYRKDREQTIEFAQIISKMETEADTIKNELRLNMPKTLFLPVDRRDILTLLRDQDGIADEVEKISQILTSRDMEVPEGIKDLLDELLEGTMEISSEAKLMIEELDELVQVGFGGREHDKVIKMIAVVRRSEHNIDNIQHRIKRALFAVEDRLNPVSVIFWYQLIEHMGNISNQAENMSDRLLLFLSK